MSGSGKQVLIVNPGSSTIKLRIYSAGVVKDKTIEGTSVQEMLRFIGREDFERIVYRVVHGGKYTAPLIIDKKVLSYLEGLKELAPVHLPKELEIIKLLMRKYPASKHIACFDTAFHSQMPEVSKVYAIPQEIALKYGVKRYGFHGLAHQNLVSQLFRKTRKKFKRVISCQLGNGVSLCAIRDGKSIDTTMGFTPLEGCVMGARSGSIDPAIISFLSMKLGKNASDAVKILENESGLFGICGERDMRVILKMARGGDKKAKFAIELFVYSVRKHIGQMASVLGGVDAIVFGGGISRSGVILDKITAGFGKVFSGNFEFFVFETDEEEEMFRMSQGL